MKRVQLAVAVLALLPALLFGQTKWKFDQAHSGIGFSVSHMVISEVTGNFRSFDGNVASAKDNDFSDAKVDFVVKVGSVNTDNEKRDQHLKSEDFFSADKYPDMVFKSKSFKKAKGNKYVLVGDLTIRNKTKEIKLDVTYMGTVKDPWGNTKAGFKLLGELNRFDYDLKWNTLLETGGAVVGKTVKITGNIELQKQ